MKRRHFVLTSLTGFAALAGGGCTNQPPAISEGPDAGGTPEASSAGSYPLQIANCGSRLRFEQPPQRIVLLESAPVTILDGLGVLDRVVSRAGAFPEGYYDEDLADRISSIPALSEDIDASGHLQISQEAVIAQQPDLVFGLPDGVTREALLDAGAQVLVQEVFCGGGVRGSFDALYSTIRTYGRILDRPDQAEGLVAALRERVSAVQEHAAPQPARTAAVLYPSLGGGPLYSYGSESMVTALLDALQIQNVFGGTSQRVFEVSVESLLAADPDVLIVLYQHDPGADGPTDDPTGAELATTLIGQDQLSGLSAVQEGSLLPLLFNFVEPASPLVVDGLEQLHDWLGGSGV